MLAECNVSTNGATGYCLAVSWSFAITGVPFIDSVGVLFTPVGLFTIDGDNTQLMGVESIRLCLWRRDETPVDSDNEPLSSRSSTDSVFRCPFG